MTRKTLSPLLTGLGLLLGATSLQAFDTEREDVRSFVDQLRQQHGFDAAYVQDILEQSKTQQKILDAISRPAEKTKPWYEYRQIFITDKRIAAGVEFRREHAERLERVASATGVPSEIIAAIIGVETFYGTRTGSWRVVDALATLGFDYPPRAKFFRSELEEFFLLTRDEGLDTIAVKGSYAGLILYHHVVDGVPSIWYPFAFADLGFLVLFAAAFVVTGGIKRDLHGEGAWG